MGVTDQLHGWALLAEHERELQKEVNSLKAELRRERERSAAFRQMLSQAASREGPVESRSAYAVTPRGR